MAVQQTQCLTLDDLYEMDDLPERFEVIRGEIIEMPPTGWDHTTIGMRIGIKIGIWLERHPIGTIGGADGGFVLSRDPLVVLIPDVSFVSAEFAPAAPANERMPEGPPQLAVEVISPSDRASRVNAKVMTYLEYGVKLVWVVDPSSKTVAIHAAVRPGVAQILHVGEALDGEDVLPEFTLLIADIFQ